jgi:hypothetical protein
VEDYLWKMMMMFLVVVVRIEETTWKTRRRLDMLLKLFLNTQSGKSWAGFIWLRIRPSGWLL